jgi:hypothetical protein
MGGGRWVPPETVTPSLFEKEIIPRPLLYLQRFIYSGVGIHWSISSSFSNSIFIDTLTLYQARPIL